MSLGGQRAPLADTKCLPVAERKQAKLACYLSNTVKFECLTATVLKLDYRKVAISRMCPAIFYGKEVIKLHHCGTFW